VIQVISISGDKEIGENFNNSRNISGEIYHLNSHAFISHTQWNRCLITWYPHITSSVEQTDGNNHLKRNVSLDVNYISYSILKRLCKQLAYHKMNGETKKIRCSLMEVKDVHFVTKPNFRMAIYANLSLHHQKWLAKYWH
jgi:hypothetical protein